MKTTMKPATKAQEIFGKDFGNQQIINERPESMRSADPGIDKLLFIRYKGILRNQRRVLKSVLN